MRHARILVAILAFVPLASATAQEQPPPLEPGARIRLWYCHPFLGTLSCEKDEAKLTALTTDSLVLQAGAVSRASVTKLEVSRPPPTMQVVGVAVLGSVAGALVGWLSMTATQPDPVTFERKCTTFIVIDFNESTSPTYTECETIRRENILNDVTKGAVMGAVGGAVLGAVVGYLELRWTEVPLDQLRMSVGPQRDGRFGLGLSVRF